MEKNTTVARGTERKKLRGEKLWPSVETKEEGLGKGPGENHKREKIPRCLPKNVLEPEEQQLLKKKENRGRLPKGARFGGGLYELALSGGRVLEQKKQHVLRTPERTAEITKQFEKSRYTKEKGFGQTMTSRRGVHERGPTSGDIGGWSVILALPES